ncbi:hypothetical protein F5J12DRAFT_970605 [Pisolithus orientalis]|uniref:uncharacterized protein n=1 Tax=Pisolithus orientalis TaxID=936130 RepID=UPI0022250A1C|nr:uncharacterized protein F5J12DRAFT_970605 [Pisolithus orientalis]KAI5988121.1 hypothetical protein F5J12DRAFT_970605 [Pisolithus orientalis]
MATSSTQPLFPSEWVSPGTHLNLMGSFKPGMVEVDCGLISWAEMIIVDSIEACVIEARELIAASLSAGDMIETGQLVEEWDCQDRLGEIQMRKSDVTVFKSVGIGLQDVAIVRLTFFNLLSGNFRMIEKCSPHIAMMIFEAGID